MRAPSGRHKPAGDHAGGVVVAADAEHADAGAGEARGFLREELAGAPVLPLAVEQVAGDQHERHLFAQREIDQVGVGGARGGADAVGGRVGVRLQPTQRAVDVQVGGVDESEAGHRARRVATGAHRRQPAHSPGTAVAWSGFSLTGIGVIARREAPQQSPA